MRTKLLTLFCLLIFAAGLQAANTGNRVTVEITALSNDANGCFEDQTLAGAVAIALNGVLASGGVCTFAAAQQISIEGGGDESGVDVVIVGTNADGRYQAETLDLTNAGTAKSAFYYKTISSITTDGLTAADIEGGPLSANGAVTPTAIPDLAKFTALMSITGDVTGTLTFTVEHTQADMPSTTAVLWFDTVAMIAKTADVEGNIVAAVGGVRGKITAYTSGSLKVTILQGQLK